MLQNLSVGGNLRKHKKLS